MIEHLGEHYPETPETQPELSGLAEEILAGIERLDGVIKNLQRAIAGDAVPNTWETRLAYDQIKLYNFPAEGYPYNILEEPIMLNDIEDILADTGIVTIQRLIDGEYRDITIIIDKEGNGIVRMRIADMIQEELDELENETIEKVTLPSEIARELLGDIPPDQSRELLWTGSVFKVIKYSAASDYPQQIAVSDMIDADSFYEDQQLLVNDGDEQYYIILPAGPSPRQGHVERYRPRIDGLIPSHPGTAGFTPVYDSETEKITLYDDEYEEFISIDISAYPELLRTEEPLLVGDTVPYVDQVYDIWVENIDGLLQVDVQEVLHGIRTVHPEIAWVDETTAEDWHLIMDDQGIHLVDASDVVLFTFPDMSDLAVGDVYETDPIQIRGERWNLGLYNNQTTGGVGVEKLESGVYTVVLGEMHTPAMPGAREIVVNPVGSIDCSNAVAGEVVLSLDESPWEQLETYGNSVSATVTFSKRGDLLITATNNNGTVTVDIVQPGSEMSPDKIAESGEIIGLGREYVLDGVPFHFMAPTITLLDSAEEEELGVVYLKHHNDIFTLKVDQSIPWIKNLIGQVFDGNIDDTLFSLNLDNHKRTEYIAIYTDLEGYERRIKAHIQDRDGKNVLYVEADPPAERIELEEKAKDEEKERGKIKIPTIRFPELADIDRGLRKVKDLAELDKAREILGDIVDEAMGKINNTIGNESTIDEDRYFELGGERLTMYDKTIYPLGSATPASVERLYLKGTDNGFVIMYDQPGLRRNTKLTTIPMSDVVGLANGVVTGFFPENEDNGSVWKYEMKVHEVFRNGRSENLLRVSVEPSVDEVRAAESGVDNAEELSKRFVWPLEVDNVEINSPFAEDRGDHLHSGIDIDTEIGDPVYAAHDGVVVDVKRNGDKNRDGKRNDGYGYYMYIKHTIAGTDYYTLYGHLKANSALYKPGDTVEQGKPIAQAGNTGKSSGSHLHFEIREYDRRYTESTAWKYWRPVDPRKFYQMQDLRSPDLTPDGHIDDYILGEIFPAIGTGFGTDLPEALIFQSTPYYQYDEGIHYKNELLSNTFDSVMHDLHWKIDKTDTHHLTLETSSGTVVSDTIPDIKSILRQGYAEIAAVLNNDTYTIRIVPYTRNDTVSGEFVLSWIVTDIRLD